MKKHSTPLPRTKIAMTLLFFLSLSVTGFAQSSSEKTAIKEWLVANKDKITLVSMKEYQAMSPAVKSMMDADAKVLIYNTEVTTDNITAFENRNTGKGLVAFKAKSEKEAVSEEKLTAERKNAELQAFKAKEEAKSIATERQNAELQIAKAEQERIAIWRSNNPYLKVISYQDYISRPEADQNEMKANGLLVTEGENLTVKDIERFQKGQILPNKQ